MKILFPKNMFYSSCIVELSLFITAEIKTLNMIFTIFFSLCHNVLKFQTNTVALEEVQAYLLLNWFKLVDDNDLRAVMKKF